MGPLAYYGRCRYYAFDTTVLGSKDANPLLISMCSTVAEMGRQFKKQVQDSTSTNRKPIPDPSVIGIIENEAKNLASASPTDAEIEQRRLFGLINEGRRFWRRALPIVPVTLCYLVVRIRLSRFRGGPMYMINW